MSQLLTDFKAFLLKGNLIMLAVAFVMGAVTGPAVFFFAVKPYEAFEARRPQADPTVKECPECTSAIPIKARRCPLCTAELAAIG